ncbi:MAG: hypothetical protein APF80_05515 [Alphaproteobacteria bacterium BRH_c36]|nr:MAG: hypothetical protein APF80_05515 [Alphaproteobacteria bacterium BRH_c36]
MPLAVLDGRTLTAKVLAAGFAALVICAAVPAHAASKPAKTPNGAKRVDIPLPVLAPWHNRPAALGKGPNAKSTAEKPSGTLKTTAEADAKPAPVEPSVTALVAPDPNVWSEDDVSESLKACVIKLASIQARVEISEPFRKGGCGAPAAVEVKKLGTRYPITLSPAATLRCDMAVSLYQFVEESLQPAAVAVLGSPIVSFQGISSYSCRNRNGDAAGKLSEHALANALDVGSFNLADGRTVRVASDWGPTDRDAERETDPVVQTVTESVKANGNVRLASLEGQRLSHRQLRRLGRAAKVAKEVSVPPTPIKKSDALKSSQSTKAAAVKVGAPLPTKKPEAKKAPAPVIKPPPPKITNEMRFLKQVHADACKYFGTVLGPEANEAHRDHFHFDMAPRKRSNYCR